MARATGSPPDIAVRTAGWPVRRMPLAVLLSLGVLAGAAVLVGLAVRPSTGQRAADLRGFLADTNAGVQSCAGGVRDSLAALRAIQSGASHDVRTAAGIASYGAANCSPANNQPLADLTQYQVPESLASFHLDVTVNDLVTWAFPLAQRVQLDVAQILTAAGPAKAAGAAALTRDLRALDAQRARIDQSIATASRATSAKAAPPPLPG